MGNNNQFKYRIFFQNTVETYPCNFIEINELDANNYLFFYLGRKNFGKISRKYSPRIKFSLIEIKSFGNNFL